MTKLYLDDIRDPETDDFIVVRSYDNAVHWMRTNGCPDILSFDHDLGDSDVRSGYDVAKWMVERDLNDGGGFIPQNFRFTVHSANPPGAANIRGLLTNYLKRR